jgi:hypothetical protein
MKGPHIGMCHWTRSIGALLVPGCSTTHMGASGEA